MPGIRYVERLRRLLVGRGAGDLRVHLAREASGTFVMQGAGMGLLFLVGLFLARILGAEGFGAYSYALSWAAILQVFAQLGLNQLLSREVSVYKTQQLWAQLRGIHQWATRSVLLVGLALAGLAALVAWAATGRATILVQATWAAMLLVPLRGLMMVHHGTLSGLGKPTYGLMPLTVVAPGLFLVVTGTLYFVRPQWTGPIAAILLMVATSAVALGCAIALARHYLPPGCREAPPRREPARWSRAVIYFFLISSIMAIQTRADIVMLGAMVGAEAAGIYTAATRGAALVTSALVAVNAPLGPLAAALHTQGDIARLQRVVTRTARVVLAVALPIAAVLAAAAPWFLSLFGREFAAGRWPLVILCLGQVINAAAGSVALLLTMGSHEKLTAFGIALATALNVTLNALLIPRWGMIGAAVASLVATTAWNLLLAVSVRRRMGMDSTAIGLPPRRPGEPTTRRSSR